MNPSKSQSSKRKTKSQSKKQPLNETLLDHSKGSSSSSNDGKISSKKRAGTTSNPSSSKKLKDNDHHNPNKLIRHLPYYDGEVLQRTPPEKPRGLERVYFPLYLKYLRNLQTAYPEYFSAVNDSAIERFEKMDDKINSTSYKSLRYLVKNINSKVTRTREQRERINEKGREKCNARIDKGLCKCLKPVSEFNRAKCLECAEKEAKQKKEKLIMVKEEGVNCHSHVSLPLREDGTCYGCADKYSNRRRVNIELFLKQVEEKTDGVIQCNRCNLRLEKWYDIFWFTLHHTDYKKPGKTLDTFERVTRFMTVFNKMDPEEAVEWYRNEEPLELLCHTCHKLEHVTNIEGKSHWAEYHRQVIDLLGGQCDMCHLKVDELKDDEVGKDQLGLSMVLHVHHLNFDGKEQRKQATEEIDEDQRELAMHVNEFKTILEMKDEERKEKLKTLQCLCSGCHYFVHMEKHTRSIIMENEQDKERMLHGLRFQRLLK